MKLYQKYLTLLLLILIAAIIYFYIQNKHDFEDRIQTVITNLLDKKIETEKAKAFNFALALSQNETLKTSIQNKNSKECYNILRNYMNTFETFSGSKVRLQIVSKEYTIFARSWDNSDAGVNIKKNRPDLQEVKRTLKPHLSFEAARRLVLIASIPIVNDNEFIGFVEVIQRFNSYEEYFANYNIDLIALLDSKYEKQAVLLDKNPRIQNMIVANKGANINHIQRLKNIDLNKLKNNGFIKKNKYAFFNKSIFNSNGENIGSFILILSEKRLKLFSNFENELESLFAYSRKDLYRSSKNKINPIDAYNNLTSKELLSLKKCTDSADKICIEKKLIKQLKKYTKEELISLLLDVNSKKISRGRIK